MSDAPKDRPAGRKFAEWITLCASILIVLAVTGYLLREAIKDHPPVVPFVLRVMAAEARQTEGGYVVPLVVTNRGERTVKDLKIRVTTNAGRDKQGQELTIDYLGEKATERVYLVFSSQPDALQIEARAESYQLE